MHHKGTVLWVDPHMEWRSPTVKNMLSALPHLLDMGWQIEFLCLRADAVDSRVAVRRLPCPGRLGTLENWWFRGLLCLEKVFGRRQKRRLVHDTGALYPHADVRSVHFDNASWWEFQRGLRPKSWKDYARLGLTAAGAFWERVFYRFDRRCWLLPVSHSMETLLRSRIDPNVRMEVLPNVLDTTRFHPGVRKLWRAPMRAELGFTTQDHVFVFASTGHYLRKGFWQAVEALAQCRALPPRSKVIRFLVVGAGETAAAELTPRLDAEYPDWKEWLTLIPPTPQIERYYAAGDAFLFPSRFESFALVSLEASACGLPLLVTPYPGVEMYFKDGVNGRLLSWDVPEMAAQITAFLERNQTDQVWGPTAWTSPREYAAALDRVYTLALDEQSVNGAKA